MKKVLEKNTTAQSPSPAGRVEIPVDQVMPNPEQPRHVFDKQELHNLAQSIRENGVILPIVVEEAGQGRYILHDGERRLRASKLAGLKTIPAVVVPPLNGTAREDRLIRALVANLQRVDLGPIEEAKSYAKLLEMGYSRNEIALQLGISSPRVSGRLKLLELEGEIQDLIERGRLPKDPHLAEALLEIPEPTARVKMAKTLADRNATLKAGIEACQRLVVTLQEEKIGSDETPAMRLATRRAGQVNRPIWDAFMQVGRVPPWALLEIGVRNTCDRCGLRDVASATTCKGCALVELLVELIGTTRKGN